jgi:ubiquitin-conjugating enzyme E2 J2
MKMYAEDDFKFPNLILRPQENNLLRWYFIVYDLQDTPYENGFYFGKVNLPSEYPLKPPDFYFITPNGRFEVNTKICTTFSGFHEETYTSTWNILTMMEGMISFMTDEHQNGIGSIEITTEQRQELALQSYLFNKNNIEFNSVFPDFDDLIEVVKQV